MNTFLYGTVKAGKGTSIHQTIGWNVAQLTLATSGRWILHRWHSVAWTGNHHSRCNLPKRLNFGQRSCLLSTTSQRHLWPCHWWFFHPRDDRLARYAYQMFSGLSYLHYHKIVHRDCVRFGSPHLGLDFSVDPKGKRVSSHAGHQSGELHANIAPCIFHVAGEISW